MKNMIEKMERVEAELKKPNSAIPKDLRLKGTAAYIASFASIIATLGKYILMQSC